MTAARIWAALGSSGTGKGAWVKQQLRKLKPQRLLIWDANADLRPEDPAYEYGEFGERVATLAELHARSKGAKRFRLRYVPVGRTRDDRVREFEGFCLVALEAGEGITVLVEELSSVTRASAPPEAWARVCNAGRHRSMHVIGVSQFPAQVDKSFMGNCTLIHCGHLANAAHRKAAAVEMDCDPEVIRALADLEFVEWQRGEREVRRGKMAFNAPTRRPTARSDTNPSKA